MDSTRSTILYIGLTHQNAPLSVREKVSLDRKLQSAMLNETAAMARGRMILNTCERFEFYASESRSDLKQWITRFAEWLDVPAALFTHYAKVLRDDAAGEHLIRVASGLQSRILGEHQILGQVRDAFILASQERAIDSALSTLSRAAIRAGKRVRSETTLNPGARSIATIALDSLTHRGIAIATSRVIILGSGGLAEVVAAELVRHCPAEMIVAGRTLERCHNLTQKYRAIAHPMRDLPTLLTRTDIVFACAGADAFLVAPTPLSFRPSSAAPIHFVDLAMPRSIDPAVIAIPGVTLTHLDELLQSESRRNEGIDAAENIVRHELNLFLKWQRERAVIARIRAVLANRPEIQTLSPAGRFELHQRIERIKAEAAA